MWSEESESDTEVKKTHENREGIELNLLLWSIVGIPADGQAETENQDGDIKCCSVPFILVLRVAWEHLDHHLAHKYEEHRAHDVISGQLMCMIPRVDECDRENEDHDANSNQINSQQETIDALAHGRVLVVEAAGRHCEHDACTANNLYNSGLLCLKLRVHPLFVDEQHELVHEIKCGEKVCPHIPSLAMAHK